MRFLSPNDQRREVIIMKLEIYDIELSEEKIENLIRAFSGFNLMEDLFEYLKKVG